MIYLVITVFEGILRSLRFSSRKCVVSATGASVIVFFSLYMLDSQMIERYVYVNEILSLLGFVAFLRKPVIYKRGDYLYNSVLVYLGVCVVFGIISLFFFVSFYGYLRNLVLLYSVFSFFLGKYLYQHFEKGLWNFVLLFAVVYFLCLFSRCYFYETIAVSFLPMVLWYVDRCKILYLCILGVLVSFLYGKSTPAAVVLFWIYVMVLHKFSGFKFFALLTVGLVIGALFWMEGAFKLMVHVHSFAELGPLFRNTVYAYDPDTLTRLYLWYQSFVKFLGHPWGIGFGTPLFCGKCVPVTDVSKIPILPYVMGSHNSYIYVLVRLGVEGFVALVSITFSVFFYFFKFKEELDSKKMSLFLSFFAIVVAAMFNVVLESPIGAPAFWVMLGMVYGVIAELRVLE